MHDGQERMLQCLPLSCIPAKLVSLEQSLIRLLLLLDQTSAKIVWSESISTKMLQLQLIVHFVPLVMSMSTQKGKVFLVLFLFIFIPSLSLASFFSSFSSSSHVCSSLSSFFFSLVVLLTLVIVQVVMQENIKTKIC